MTPLVINNVTNPADLAKKAIPAKRRTQARTQNKQLN